MPVFDTQNVLRRNRKQATHDIRPVRGRAYQYPNTDARDVGTGGMEPLSHHQPAERQFGDDAGNDGQHGFLVALEDSKREMASEQDACNENWREITVLRTKEPLDAIGRLWWRRRLEDRSSLRAHAASLILWIWLRAGLSNIWTLPEGQRITAFSIFASLPNPK